MKRIAEVTAKDAGLKSRRCVDTQTQILGHAISGLV